MRSDPPAGGPLQCTVNRGRTSLSGTTPPARLLGAKTGPAPDTDQAARPAFGPDRLPAASTGWGGIANETATLRLPGHDEDQTRARAHARRALVRGCPGVQVEPRSAGRTVRPLTPVTRKQRPFGSANGPRDCKSSLLRKVCDAPSPMPSVQPRPPRARGKVARSLSPLSQSRKARRVGGRVRLPVFAAARSGRKGG